MDLKNQLQEAKKTKENLVVLLKERIQASKKLKNRLFNLENGLMKNISNQSLRTTQGS